MSIQPEESPYDPEWTFGDRIRKVRIIAGMDQREFAVALGTTPSALAQWETGRATPRDIVAIAKRAQALTTVAATWVLGFNQPVGEPTDSFLAA